MRRTQVPYVHHLRPLCEGVDLSLGEPVPRESSPDWAGELTGPGPIRSSIAFRFRR